MNQQQQQQQQQQQRPPQAPPQQHVYPIYPSAASATGLSTGPHHDYQRHHAMGEHENNVLEQDRYLPIANIARIMKTVLPENAKIGKDSKETVQECVSEFISFITSEASDKCMQEKRKTINGDDLLWAMSTLGFDKYVEPLKVYLSKYREAVRGDKPEKSGDGALVGRPPAMASMAGEGVGVSSRPTKKTKHNG